MIEVKLSFETVAEMLAHFACTTQPALGNVKQASFDVDTPKTSNVQSAAYTPEELRAYVRGAATVTPEKQEAARASTKVSKKEDPKSNPETPIEALIEVVKDDPKPRVYESSGIPEKIAVLAKTDSTTARALLKKHGAVGPEPECRVSGKFLLPANFEAFEADIDVALKG